MRSTTARLGDVRVQVHEFELSVGDVLHIAGRVVTVIDIDGEDISLRVDHCPEGDAAALACSDSGTRPGK